MMLFGNLTNAELIEEAREILAKAKERVKPKLTLAMFSGGNDSTTMLRLVKDQVDAAVHIRTGIGIESTFKHVWRTCKLWGVPLIVLRTDPNEYRKIVLSQKAKGFPGPAFHYVCYHRLKQKRLRELQRDYTVKEEYLLFVSGLRRKESARRANRPSLSVDHEARRCYWSNPLIKADSLDMANLRMELEIPQCEASGLIHKSGECLCGAFAKPGELEELEYWFPVVGKYIRDLEKEAAAAGKPYCKWGHGKIQGEAQPVGPLCQGCQLPGF